MVLGIDYEETPEVSASTATTEEFWDVWTGWAEERGAPMLFYYDDKPIDRSAWIATVPSLNLPGQDHAVVMHGRELALDPARGETYESVAPWHVKYGITFEADRATR